MGYGFTPEKLHITLNIALPNEFDVIPTKYFNLFVLIFILLVSQLSFGKSYFVRAR